MKYMEYCFIAILQSAVKGERRNVALDKPAYSSRSSVGNSTVDGYTNTCLYLWGSSSWWEVDLQSTYDINEVIVNIKFKYRSNNIVSGGVDCNGISKCYTKCYHHQSQDLVQYLTITNCTARYVRITSLFYGLTLCEVQIYGYLHREQGMASTPKGKDTTPIHDAPILTKPTPKALRPSELSTTPIPNVSTSLDTDDTTVEAMTTTSGNLSKAYSKVSPVSEVTRKSTPGAQRSSMLESKVRSDETVFTTTKSNDLVSSRDPLPSTIRNNPPFSEALTADITETTSPKNTDLVSPGDAIFFNGSSYCECFCRAVYQTADMAEFIAEVKAEIKKNLTVATEQLTSTIRKKTSATDKRPSAVYTGYIGIVLIILSLGSLILSDLISLITFVYHRVQVLFNNA